MHWRKLGPTTIGKCNGSKGNGKGKKRPRDDDWSADSDRSWQSRADPVGATYAKLLKTVEKASATKALGMMVIQRKIGSTNHMDQVTKAKARKVGRRNDGLTMN